MALATPTKPHFPRFEPPLDDFDSRSPSRSPRRKAQFAIRELDPLLANLSPDATLKALRTTETIPGGATQDALTTSIRDATPTEREIGIRAAFAAQKLREWRNEVTQWKWPSMKERALGFGFIPPQHAESSGVEYMGSLPLELVDQYEGRLEEIRDDLDSLGIEEIKDHVLESHVPAVKSDLTIRPTGARTSYGRMRDLTALITATVIQALPDLAKLNILLDEWDIRLKVLRNLPKFQLGMASVQKGLQTAFQELRDPGTSRNITDSSYDTKKVYLGDQVSDLGRRADRLLDILEGHEDSLPQTWIDRLERIELDYATWVVDAHHTLVKNKLTPTFVSNSESTITPDATTGTPTEKTKPGEPEPEISATLFPRPTVESASQNESNSADLGQEPKAKRKPSLTIALPQTRGHKREVSKVSVAESTLSTFSDISNAEIIDVTRTSVLPSPKVNVVDNPLKHSGEEIVWFGKPSVAQAQQGQKPPMLQRASTTSIEVVPNNQLKRVVLTRSASWDMLSPMPESPSTPSKALKQLTGDGSPQAKTPLAELEDPTSSLTLYGPTLERSPLPSPSPSLMVEPLRVRTKPEDWVAPPLPVLPRRSSKRNTIATMGPSSPLTPISSASPVTPATDQDLESISHPKFNTTAEQTTPRHAKTASLDEKIQDLLTTLPTKIRLAKENRSSVSTQGSSNASTRASTPTPGLTLSAVRSEPSSRKSSIGDSEIRLYHLTRAGQSRDTPPVKLFVRTIGDGNRVMVRVGGGWADLGEYLKEYSLHHGSRATGDGHLEVASFPVNGHRDSMTAPNTNGVAGSQARRKSKSPTLNQNPFENGSPSESLTAKPRLLTKTRPVERNASATKDDRPWTPPPVPAIPASFTTKSPTMTTMTTSDGTSRTSVRDVDPNLPPNALSFENPVTPSLDRSSTLITPGVTTTTVVTPPTTISSNYTPLGAAGPKLNSKRASTYGGLPAASRDAWVEGMVGKARAVSGGSTTIINGPTTTTTTTSTLSSTPTSRRASYFGSSPGSSPASNGTVSPSASTVSTDRDTKSRRASLMTSSRPKSRMSLSDIGGIKRVFLRKKTGDPVK